MLESASRGEMVGGVWSRGGLLLGGSGPRGVSGPGGYIPACTEVDPPPVDRQTPVKILPWPNFVAAGKNDCDQW